MVGINLTREKNTRHVVLIVFAISLLLLGAAGCRRPTEETAVTPAVVGEGTPSPAFDCSGGVDGQPLECTANSLSGQVGVSLTLPWQERDMRVEVQPFMGNLDDLESERDDFKPARLITSFQVVEIDTDEIVTQFDPPLMLTVEYTEEHYAMAKEQEADLALGYWRLDIPEAERRWVQFGEKHEFTIEGDENGGVLRVSIEDWGDPLIGTGP